MTKKNGTVGTGPNSNTKVRAFCITINNPIKDDHDVIRSFEKYVYQLEKGENGTVHIQGLIYNKNPMSFESLKKKLVRAHIEKCRDMEASIKYCSKEDSRIEGPFVKGFTIPKPLNILKESQLYKWQNKVIDLINDHIRNNDDRTIYSILDIKGNIGKTALCRYIVGSGLFNSIYISSGKACDIKFALAQYKNLDDLVILFDLPRSVEEYVSYQAIEEVKNGIYLSTKYESKMILHNSPFIIIFHNFELQYDKLSKDRWKVAKLDNKEAILNFKNL